MNTSRGAGSPSSPERRWSVAATVCLGALLVVAPAAHAATIDGSAADEHLRGTSKSDTIDARGGDDVVLGGAGGDDLRGGSGDDRIRGGGGDDTINGGPGANDLHGARGNDLIYSFGGADVLDGGAGRDTFLVYARGLARVAGGAGDDEVEVGGDGGARIRARLGPGGDSVSFFDNANGADVVNCGAGIDSVHYIGVPDESDTLISCEVVSYQDD